MFKKVIGQDHSEPNRPAPTPQETHYPESAAQPITPSYGAQSSVVAPPATRNVLSSDVEIKGTVRFANDLVVDGKIEGEISSDGNLTIGENARIKAEVKTATIVIYGKVHGNLTATNHIELKGSAEVVGDIKAKTLTIEAGAIFVGKSTVGTPAQTPAAQNAPTSVKPSPVPDAPKQQGTLPDTNS